MNPKTTTQTPKRWRSTSALQTRARQFRKALTPAEKKLWQAFRRTRLNEAHIRKQHAVGPFIVDFFCAKAKLVIELDGDTHAEQREYDAARTQWLKEQKDYQVLRFTNEEVHQHMEAVLEEILRVVEGNSKQAPKEAPFPGPSPATQGQGARLEGVEI